MKKSEVRELVLRLYEEASLSYKAIGSQKIQLMSSSIFGLVGEFQVNHVL